MSGFVVGLGNADRRAVEAMLERVAHRGRHFSGVWQRDSVIMAQNYLRADADATEIGSGIPAGYRGSISLCYDGQLGNAMPEPAEVRQGLAEEAFLISLYRREGINMLSRLDDAIYTFAVSDGKRLLAARDLLGIKTLFWGRKNGALYLASELKSLAACMEDVHEFPPGHCMDESGTLSRYAQLPSEPPAQEVSDIAASTQEIRRIIQRNIRSRVSFKRPTGGLLSGGMDSSVVCLLASQRLREMKGPEARLRTFAVGVGESGDIVNSRLVARRIQSDHREVIVTPEQVLEVLPEVIYYLESFDPSLVRSSATNYLVSRAAGEEGVEVLLSGEGGDELFCGYAYFKSFPVEKLFGRQMECLGYLHNNASLRLDRMNQAHSIKVVAPLVSGDLLRYAMRIPAQHKLKPQEGKPQETGRMEKWILRKAFEPDLPPEITWRGKQEFSQGSGSAALLESFFEEEIAEPEFRKARREFPFLRSKEELFYFRIFTDHFGRGKAVETVGVWPH